MWPLLNIFLFILLLFIMPAQYSFKFQTFVYSLVFLFVGFVLFLLKIMGAGDTKYLFSFYILVPVSLHETALLLLLYTTVFLGLCVLLVNIIKNFDKIIKAISVLDIREIKRIFGKKLPFAPMILISWVWLGWEKWESVL